MVGVVVQIPEAWRQQPRWYVYRTEQGPGQMFGERRLHAAFKEYPGQTAHGFSPPRFHSRGKKRGTPDLAGASDLNVALSYFVFRDGQFDGVAYVREDGSVEYIDMVGGAA